MYLLNAKALMQMAESVDGDAKTKGRLRFAVQQWIDAASPSNYLALNPEALAKAMETKGESIASGMQLLLQDLQKGHVSQTDESVFEVGRNVATTAGTVVFENELFQLIEYKPLTAKVHERPMLFVPPCINKYYILDLQPDNSVIRYNRRARVTALSSSAGATPMKAWSTRPGTTTSSTARSPPSAWCRASRAPRPSTRWASASAAPSCPLRWRYWRHAVNSRRIR